MDEQADEPRARWSRVHDLLHSASGELGSATGAAGSVVDTLTAYEGGVREAVDRGLAARGLDGARIKEFQALNRQASLLASYEAALDRMPGERDDAERASPAVTVTGSLDCPRHHPVAASNEMHHFGHHRFGVAAGPP